MQRLSPHLDTNDQTDIQTYRQIVILYISIYIYKKLQSVCLSVSLSVCSCLNSGLTAARINLIFGINTLIGSDCAIGYMILTFQVIKGHFRSNKFFCQVLLGVKLKIGWYYIKIENSICCFLQDF